MVNNEHTLKSIIQFSAESARDELNRIDCARLEELLPDKEFQDLFSHICTTDEMLKTVVEELRTKKGLTQQDLAELLDINRVQQ